MKKTGILRSVLLWIGIILAVSAIAVYSLSVYIHWHPVNWDIETPEAAFDLYLNTDLKTNTTAIALGTLMPGDTIIKNLTVVNTGNVPIKVAMAVENLPTGYTLLWAADNTVIGVDAKAEGDLTFTVPSNATTGGTCDIWVIATEQS